MVRFVGIIDGSGDVWGVRLPDLPGCVGGGATPEAAISDAIGALREVAAYKQSGGFPLPRASTLSEILATGEVQASESTVLLPLLLDKGRTMRANVTFDAGLLEAIDDAARQRGLTRSAFLASAARDKILAQA